MATVDSNAVHALDMIQQEQANHLHTALVTFQRNRAKWVGPLVLVALTGIYINDRTIWQTLMLVAVMAVTQAFFIMSFYLAKGKRVDVSIWMGTVPIILFSTLVNWLFVGFLPVAMLAYTGLILQASIFSKRLTLVTAALAIVAYMSCELINHFRPWPMYEMSDWTRLSLVGVMSVVILAQFLEYLVKFKRIHSHFLQRASDLTQRQENVIETVQGIQPAIDNAVEIISAVSKDFADQASQQASAIAQVGATVDEVMQTSSLTTESADKTRVISERTKEELEANSTQLMNVEHGFDDVFKNIQYSQSQIAELVEQVEKIDEILKNNEAIGEHVKVLAVNAAIEAAKAGEYGAGFNVVSLELGEMIASTEQNLQNGHALLDQIRARSRTSTEAIRNTGSMLAQYHNALKMTGRTIENSVNSFKRASEQVRQIAHAAKEQQLGLSEMSGGVTQIQNAATSLKQSSATLIDAVTQIQKSHNELNRILDAKN